MRVRQVDLGAQNKKLKKELEQKLLELIDSSSFILGKPVRDFEAAFAEYLGVQHVVGVGNGTDALFLALKALGIGPGDQVITSVQTFIATAEAILHAGAEPVFVDIDIDTYNLDAGQIEQNLTAKTKGIIPVHFYGQPANLEPILEIAKSRGLFVVEDAAQAHGAECGKKKVGSFGHASCFSFYPTKNLGACGDGGAVATNDDEIARRIRQLRNHGEQEKYQHEMPGYNSRLDDFQAAILLVKLPYLDGWNEKRRQHAKRYNRLLSSFRGIILPEVLDGRTHVYHQYVIRTQGLDRNNLRQYLLEQGVDTGIHYPVPVHLTHAFAQFGYKEGDFPIAETCAAGILSLPVYAEMEPEQIEYVAGIIGDYVQKSDQA